MDCEDRIDAPAERQSPVGEPVVRGDSTLTGPQAREAIRFDPEDPESVDLATDLVYAFAAHETDDTENIYLLRGAAACAVLVRAEGSYKAAAERVGGEASVSFIRKWARVHDLPRAIRIQVAKGTLAPSAAKHIARLKSADRYCVAWAAIDNDLSVREVRTVVSDIASGTDPEEALATIGVTLGAISLRLSEGTYRELRRTAALNDVDPEHVVDAALDEL